MSKSIDYGPWAAMRLRDGADVNSIDAARMAGCWIEWLGVCRMLNGADRRAAFETWTKHHPAGRAIVQQVLAVPASMTEYPDTAQDAPERTLIDLPALPKSVSVTAAMERAASDTGEFLTDYCDHVAQIVNTMPREMSEAAALCVVSIAVARRVHFATYFEPAIYPLLWVLWVAESTVFHKTTALNAARRLIRATMPHLLLPEESSGDRLIQDLAGMDPSNYSQMSQDDQARWQEAKRHAGQRGIVIDEASSLFSGFRKDYNIGKIETFLKAYDCDDERVHSTVKHGNIYLRNLYMPLLGATTPAAIQGAANLQMWQMGFWPRFVILTPERFPDPLIHHDEPIARPASLDAAIQRLLTALPLPEAPAFGSAYHKPPVSLAVRCAAEVWRRWTQYNDAMSHTLQNPEVTPDMRLRLMYGRMPVKVLQVSTLLAALDWDGSGAPQVKLSHYARALQIAENWRANAHRFVAVMDQPLAGEDRERRIVRAIEHLQQRGTNTTARDIQKVIGWPRDQVDALLGQMQADGIVEQVDSTTKRTKVWRVVA